MSGASLANIETGRPGANGKRRRGITVDELVAFAAVLATSPALLVYPEQALAWTESPEIIEDVGGTSPLGTPVTERGCDACPPGLAEDVLRRMRVASETQYRDDMDMVAAAGRLVQIVDLDRLLAQVIHAQTLGPILEPTAWIRGGADNLHDQERVVRAALAFKDVCRDVVERAGR